VDSTAGLHSTQRIQTPKDKDKIPGIVYIINNECRKQKSKADQIKNDQPR